MSDQVRLHFHNVVPFVLFDVASKIGAGGYHISTELKERHIKMTERRDILNYILYLLIVPRNGRKKIIFFFSPFSKQTKN